MRCPPHACAIVLSSPNLTALAADYDHQRGCREPESEPSHDLSITRSRRREEEAHGRVISLHAGATVAKARLSPRPSLNNGCGLREIGTFRA